MNFPNRTIYGLDNLRVLREMDANTIDLIYLDPPFNKKEEFNSPLQGKVREEIHAFIAWFNAFNAEHGLKLCDRKLAWKKDFERPSFKDTWDSDADFRNMDGWSAELEESHPQTYTLLQCVDALRAQHRHYKAHLSYLTFMAVRLVELKRILKPTGSLYLHCDPTMSHWIKILVDTIFGSENFRNEIVWKRTSSSGTPLSMGRVHDTIFYYVKTHQAKYHSLYVPLSEQHKRNYSHSDAKGRFMATHIEVAPALQGGGSHYTYKGYTPKRGWLVSLPKLKELDAEGRLYWTKNGKPLRKYYLHESKGRAINNFWDDISPVAPVAKERVGYPTQKPLALLERIIQASTQEGDMVLDPFCGCATTCIAAHNLKRGYVGIDISEASYVLNVYRLYKEVFGWTKDGLFNGRGVVQYAEDTPLFSEKAPKLTLGKEDILPAYVYVIANSAWPGQYKVGIASDPDRRLRVYNTGSPMRDYTLAYRLKCLNYREVERAVHEHFPNDYEWVTADLKALIAFIEAQAQS